MGFAINVTHNTFPKQSDWLGKRVRVLFRYGSNDEPELHGTIVRDDIQDPWKSIIKLDDGRYVLTTECQYSLELKDGKT
jgi:hypothetical protein